MSAIQLLTVAGTDALSELQRLRGQYASTGLYPILFGSAQDHERVEEGRDDVDDATIAAIIEASRAIDPARWAAARVDGGRATRHWTTSPVMLTTSAPNRAPQSR